MDLYLDPDSNDLAVATSGAVRFTAPGIETVSQRLRIRLRTFLGEWFLSLRIGLPYYRDILVRAPDLGVIRSIFRGQILSDPDVVSVPRVDVTLEAGRVLAVVFEATIRDGGIITAAVPLIPTNSGAGCDCAEFRLPFTGADLVAGVLSVHHGLALTYPYTAYTVVTNTLNEVIGPDLVRPVDGDTLEITLGSYAIPPTDAWSVLVIGG